MRSEDLRSRVKLQVLDTGTDAIGQPSTDWLDFATVWADIRCQGGLEAIKGGAEVSTVKASVRIRYRDDVEAKMRVLHGATAYDIKAVLPDLAKHEYVDLVCEVVQ